MLALWGLRDHICPEGWYDSAQRCKTPCAPSAWWTFSSSIACSGSNDRIERCACEVRASGAGIPARLMASGASHLAHPPRSSQQWPTESPAAPHISLRAAGPRPPDSIPPHMKKAKTEVDALECACGQFDIRFCDAMAVSISNEAVTKAVETKDADVCSTLEKLPGTYWMVGSDSSGYSVYRQEPSNGINSKQLFLFYKPTPTEEGWYIADTLYDAGPDHIYAWCKTVGPGQVTLHVPYWAKKGWQGLVIEPHHSWARGSVDERTAAKDKRIAELEAQIEDLNRLAEARIVADNAASEEGKINQNGKGGTKGGASQMGKGGKTTAGWGNRCIKLILAVRAYEWDKAMAMANEWADIKWIRPIIELREKQAYDKANRDADLDADGGEDDLQY